MIGDRIRQARLAAGLTLEELAKALGPGVITKAGLSKYELNKSVPDSQLLTQVAKALGVKVKYFLKEPEISVEWLAYRKRTRLSKARQAEVRAKALKWVESYCTLTAKLFPDQKIPELHRIKVKTFEDAETAARKLRDNWNLGQIPIKSVTQLIEDRHGIVVLLVSDEKFDGLSGWINQRIPVVISNSLSFDDRIRFNLAHELGHLVMECPQADPKKEEQLAHRFAAAFLIPREMAFEELGKSRRSLSFEELGILKQKYGVSMQAWMRRAVDLEIISPSCYQALNMELRRRNLHKQEPVQFQGQEKPQKIGLMILRAMKEGLIGPDWVQHNCPVEILEMDEIKQKPEGSESVSKLLQLPVEQRRAILQQAASEVREEYRNNKDLTAFTDLNNDDFNVENGWNL